MYSARYMLKPVFVANYILSLVLQVLYDIVNSVIESAIIILTVVLINSIENRNSQNTWNERKDRIWALSSKWWVIQINLIWHLRISCFWLLFSPDTFGWCKKNTHNVNVTGKKNSKSLRRLNNKTYVHYKPCF